MTTIDDFKLDELEAGPDLDVIAVNIVAGKKKLKKGTPAATDLATAITGLSISDTIHGSSTLSVTIMDPDFLLMDSGFFDADRDGRVDAIDLNYPDGSKLWWRLTQCNPRSAETIEMVFMERAAVHMMAHRGPLKRSRAKRTRAQFIETLTKAVKGKPIIFVSKDLDVVQTPEGSAVSGAVLNAGDSLAVGTGTPLHAIRASVSTRATVGFTSTQVLNDLQGAGSLPKNLVISAGTNDTDVSDFRNNIRSILALPKVETVFWVDISRPVLGGTTDSELNTVLREEQAGHPNELRIVGWKYAVTQGRAELSGDDIHPTAAGYEYRAKLINKALGHSAAVTVPARSTPAESKAAKDPGISSGADVKIAGKQANTDQLVEVERALGVAHKLDAPDLAVLAMVCAGIGESNFRPVVNSLGYGGVFQGQVETGGRYFKKEDTEAEATYFLKGGKGFGAGGAIALANAHPDMDPGEIATRVEVSGVPGSFYGKFKEEAKALIEAGGGGGGGSGGTTYHKQYNFEVGTTDKPHENFWDAANRLADDVKWAFFLDGQYAYYDPETTLIRQKPVATITRDDPSVLSWQCEWDQRQIATEMRIDLICEPFEFRAGEVFVLVDFGPASKGSTVGLPGRWLISDIDRTRSNIYSSFTLKQPTTPEPEPESDLGKRPGDPTDAGGDIEGSPKDIIDNVVLPIARECGIAKTANQNDVDNKAHSVNTTSGNRSDHKGPPEVAWAADMSNSSGGNFDKSAPTPEMDKLAKALADKFGISWSGSGIGENTDGGFRYQMLYRTDAGGGHWNHVHFGVKALKL